MDDRQKRTLHRLFRIGGREMAACEALYELGQRCPAGTEAIYLGAGKGLGVIALTYGCYDGHGAAVVALDDEGNDATDFAWNVERAGIKNIEWRRTHYRREARKVEYRAGLVVWDTGHGPRVGGDFAAWAPRIIEGGLFAVAGNRAAFPVLQERAQRWCWLPGPKWYEARVWTLRKCEYDEDTSTGRTQRRKGRAARF